MFNRYRAHIRGQPERKFWKAELIAEPLIGTKEEIEAYTKLDPLARGEFPSDRPTEWLSKDDANWISSKYKDAVIVIEDNEIVKGIKELFGR